MLQYDQLPTLLQASISNYLDKNNATPAIIFNPELLVYNFNFLKKTLLFEPSDIYYSIKSNICTAIIDVLNAEQSGFEIGSLQELENLKKHDIAPNRILFSNPVKIPAHIEAAYNYGVDTFCCDNENELHKLAKHAPRSKIFVRLAINNEGASWKLTGKFGCPIDKVVDLFKKAKKLQLKTAGITLHLGWNNNNNKTWLQTLLSVENVVKQCYENDIKLDFVDLGGGFPAHLNMQYEELDQIAENILPILQKLKRLYHVRIIAEPGSFIVANTAAMIVSIFDIFDRGGKRWVFVDSGINQGFYWIYTGLQYGICTIKQDADNKTINSIVTGPSCDTHDVFNNNIALPANIEVGDKLIVYPAGAYISSSVSYNGFSTPPLIKIVS